MGCGVCVAILIQLRNRDFMRFTWFKLAVSWFAKFKREPTTLEGKGLEFAFKANGKRWYKWQVVEQMPILRLMMAKDYLDQLEVGAERRDIVAYLEVVTKAINEPNINRSKLAIITEQLSQRLQMVTNTDLLYRLAGVYFVTDSEVLEQTTIELVELKADAFKASMPISDFFLMSRLRDFLPSGNTSQLNLEAFSRAETVEQKERLQSLLLFLSSLTDKDYSLTNSLANRVATLSRSKN